GDVVGRGLGDDHDQLDASVGVEAAHRLTGGGTADLRGEVAAPDAEGGAHADPRVVEQRQQLLAAGAGRGDDADRAGGDDVGEAESEPADHGGAAVGAHHQHATLGGGPLERDLLVERHVVAEDHHVATRVDRVHRLDQRVGTRD